VAVWEEGEEPSRCSLVSVFGDEMFLYRTGRFKATKQREKRKENEPPETKQKSKMADLKE